MDKKKIIELAKSRGLQFGEEAVEGALQLACDLIGEIIKETENSYDDLIWAGVEGKVRDQIPKIDFNKDGK